MPKVVKMYGKSRRGLKHNMGGWFEKKEKPPQPVEPPAEPLVEPKPKPPISDVGKDAMSAIERRKKALTDIMGD